MLCDKCKKPIEKRGQKIKQFTVKELENLIIKYNL